MGERKVLNKYYPPDFDPSKIPRRRRQEGEAKQIKVRMMLPFSLRCTTCSNYIYKGTKFNSRKEDVENETYLGIRIFRFYFRCPRCSAEIAMKTDPKNSDYICELGASRNFEPQREQQRQEEDERKKREDEEEGDAMRALENRTLDSKREMDFLNALDEMKTANARHAKLSTAQVMAALKRSDKDDTGDFDLQEEDEEAVKQLFLRKKKQVKRIEDDPVELPGPSSMGMEAPEPRAGTKAGAAAGVKRPSATVVRRPSVLVVKKKPKTSPVEPGGVSGAIPPAAKGAVADDNNASALTGLMAYGSSSEDT